MRFHSSFHQFLQLGRGRRVEFVLSLGYLFCSVSSANKIEELSWPQKTEFFLPSEVTFKA